MNEKYQYSACDIASNNKAARIAAARANGLPEQYADDIQIIDGIPEYRPQRKQPTMTGEFKGLEIHK